MILRNLLIVLSALVISCSQAETTGDELYFQLFKALNYSETSRATFKSDCQHYDPLALAGTPDGQLKILCPKLDLIPDSVMETVALSYVKLHVSPKLARKAISFWSSNEGKRLKKKLTKEIATKKHDQLNADDIKLLQMANQSEYGHALGAFASDKAHGLAVVQTMLGYEPTHHSSGTVDLP